jgi:hypothetical protein
MFARHIADVILFFHFFTINLHANFSVRSLTDAIFDTRLNPKHFFDRSLSEQMPKISSSEISEFVYIDMQRAK